MANRTLAGWGRESYFTHGGGGASGGCGCRTGQPSQLARAPAGETPHIPPTCLSKCVSEWVPGTTGSYSGRVLHQGGLREKLDALASQPPPPGDHVSRSTSTTLWNAGWPRDSHAECIMGWFCPQRGADDPMDQHSGCYCKPHTRQSPCCVFKCSHLVF